MRQEMMALGWDVKKYEEEGRFAIVNTFTSDIEEVTKREQYIVIC